MEQDDRFFEQQDLIRRFLNGKLKGEDLEAFEARLLVDEELEKELEFNKSIQAYFKKKEQNRLKEEFVKLKEQNRENLSSLSSNAISNDEPEILLSVLTDLECVNELKEKVRRKTMISVEMMNKKKVKFRQGKDQLCLNYSEDESLCLGPLKFYFNQEIEQSALLDIRGFDEELLISKKIAKGLSKDCIDFDKVLTTNEELLNTGYYYFILTVGDQSSFIKSFYYIRPEEVTELFLEDID